MASGFTSSSDIRRKDALDDWFAKLADAENTVQQLKSACLDARFLDRNITPSMESSRPGVSFESLCLALEKNRHRLEALRSEILLVYATVSNFRNRSIILAPIHRLPDELLQVIFLLAASDNNGVGPYRISSKFPRLASKVCRKWRDICREMSAFWTLLRFNDVPTLHWTALCIQWARGRPLSVDINYESPRPSEIESMLPQLNAVIPRIEWMRLGGCTLGEMITILSLFLYTPHTDVWLKSLTLSTASCGDGEDDERERQFNDLLDRCLRRYQQIQELSLSGVQLQPQTPLSPALISLHLHAVELCSLELSILSRLTRGLVTPKLDSLTVDRRSQAQCTMLYAFINRCGRSAIKALQLQFWEEGFEEILANCPAVETLTLAKCDVEDSLFQALTPCCRGVGEICPHVLCPKM
jgi:hypothetical protein